MRTERALALVVVASVGIFGAAVVLAAGAPSWGKAIEVPGTAVLNTGKDAATTSVSCAAAGNCVAAGYYRHGSSHEAFVAREKNGVWGKAIEVRGTAALNRGGDALLGSVSCASRGNCTAGGFYTDGSGHVQAFVVDEKKGVWRKAIEVPGTAVLNTRGSAEVTSVSCASAGNCAAGGYYSNGSGSGRRQVFVASEKNGVWRKAIEVPGTASLNRGGDAWLNSVSCASAGNCAASGYYHRSSENQQAFVVDEKNNVWRTAIRVPGTAALNTGQYATVNSVACASAGNCAAGGEYTDSSSETHRAFVVDETNGVWGSAVEVPGTAALDSSGAARVESVSCSSAGNCSAGGGYGRKDSGAFVADENNGVWETAIEVPGLATLNTGNNASVSSVSCGSAGNCAAGGWYVGSHGYRTFLAGEASGVWGNAVVVRGIAAFNRSGLARAISVSCVSAGNCVSGGFYLVGGTVTDGKYQAFVTSP